MAMSARGLAYRSGRRAEGEERRDLLLYLSRSPAIGSRANDVRLSMRSNHAADLNKLQRVRKTGPWCDASTIPTVAGATTGYLREL